MLRLEEFAEGGRQVGMPIAPLIVEARERALDWATAQPANEMAPARVEVPIVAACLESRERGARYLGELCSPSRKI